MAVVIVQCSACRALVPVSAVHVDTAGGAGLPCAACGVVTWLPPVGAPSSSIVPTSTPAPPAPLASTTSALAPPAVQSPGGAIQDVRAQLVPVLDALPTPDEEQQPLDAAFRALLPVWQDAAAHTAFLKRASATDQLAFAGQRYRAALQQMPGDERAKKAQQDLLRLAMAHLSSGMGVEPKRGTSPWALAATAVLLIASIGFLVWVLTDIAVVDAPDQPATIR